MLALPAPLCSSAARRWTSRRRSSSSRFLAARCGRRLGRRRGRPACARPPAWLRGRGGLAAAGGAVWRLGSGFATGFARLGGFAGGLAAGLGSGGFGGGWRRLRRRDGFGLGARFAATGGVARLASALPAPAWAARAASAARPAWRLRGLGRRCGGPSRVLGGLGGRFGGGLGGWRSPAPPAARQPAAARLG